MKHRPRILVIAFAAGIAAVAPRTDAQDAVSPKESLKTEGIAAFLEGPAWHPSGNVYFSDVENNRILRRDPKGKIQVWRQPSGRANGLVFDLEGRLVACEGAGEGGNRRVTRTELDGTITVLADRYEGKRFNSPNDLTIDSAGRIYFTDPRYGARNDLEQLDGQGQPIEGVYRIDPDGKVTRVIGREVQRANGAAVSPDGKILYVVDNNNGTADGNRKVWRFDLAADGGVVAGSQKLLHDFGRGRGGDGIACDTAGRVYVAAGFNMANPPLESADVKAGIHIFAPDGKPAGFIPVAIDMVTNCCFGGADRKTLYITAGHMLFSHRVETPGFEAWPKLTP